MVLLVNSWITKGGKGNWIAATPIPEETLETLETRLEGEDREQFLAMVRKVFCWLSEERPNAEDLYLDDFLQQAHRDREAANAGNEGNEGIAGTAGTVATS